MSKLNLKKPLSVKAPYGVALSGNGNLQSVKSPEQTLFEVVVSTFYGADSMYENADDKVTRLRDSLLSVIKTHGNRGVVFTINLAKFSREEMYMRTMPIVLVVELAKIIRDLKLEVIGMKNCVTSVINRADELTDFYAYALTVFGSKREIPLSIKKGVAAAFNKFDAYQFGKYNRDSGLRFRDLLRIVHPTPSNETQGVIFKKLMDETLESPFTWEVELSKNGQLPADEQRSKKEIWTEFVNREGSGSLGYMALLRNLRNMNDAGIDANTWKKVASKISDPIAVAKSKQFPFRFVSAWEIAKASNLPDIVLNALSDAAELSLSNIPKMGDGVWIILDCSGSMEMGHDSNSSSSPIKTGAIFAAALFKAASSSFKTQLTMFDDFAKHINLNARDSIFTNFERIMARNAGGGTNLRSALNEKDKLGFEPDTVIVLSDMEVNSLQGYNVGKTFKNDCVKIAINLNSRDTTPVGEHEGWTQLAGWSDKIFQFVDFKRNAESITKKLFNSSLT